MLNELLRTVLGGGAVRQGRCRRGSPINLGALGVQAGAKSRRSAGGDGSRSAAFAIPLSRLPQKKIPTWVT